MITLLAMVGVFSSVDEAAIAALRESQACSAAWRECGGVVYAVEGGYSYTTPVTQNNSSRVDLGGPYTEHPHAVADYHTHPCLGNKPLNNAFSPGDVAVNQGFHNAGYMLSLCDHYVRRWAPGDDVADIEVDFHSGRKIFLTAGHIVGIIR